MVTVVELQDRNWGGKRMRGKVFLDLLLVGFQDRLEDSLEV